MLVIGCEYNDQMTAWPAQLEQLKNDSRTPIFLTAILALFILLTVWNTISVFMIKTPAATKIIAPHQQTLQSIAKLHLMGVYGGSLNALPNTQLHLTLEGTVVFTAVPAESRAMIATPNQPTQVYKVGDIIAGNATITRISKHYVVLNDHGTLQKLPLPMYALTAVDDQ